MKTKLWNLLCIGAWVCAACTPSPKKMTQLTEAYVKEAFEAIPNHEFHEDSKNYLSTDFYELLVEAFDVPSNAPGDIGDEEFLFYLITAQDSEPTDSISEIEIIAPSTALVTYSSMGKEKVHRLTFVNEDGQWRLDDFDNNRKRIEQYVEKSRLEFSGNGPMKMLQDANLSPTDPDHGQPWLESVENYKEKYNIP